MSLSEEQTEALESAWKQFIDCKDKGIIDFDEWNDSIRRLNCGLSETDSRNVFKLIDQQNSGHIDQSDFIKTIINDNHSNNRSLSIILQSLLPNKHNKNKVNINNNHNDNDDDDNDDDKKEEDEMTKWHKIFTKYFGENSRISQDLWIDKMLKLNIDGITDDDLRLFHAVMDSQFRSCFDFDEFYETFTINSLHHQEMDGLRDKLKSILLPKPKKEIKERKEISIQTEMFDLREIIKKQMDEKEEEEEEEDDDNLDEEINNLERHIIEEEKYLEIMDEIDNQKKRNNKLFKWENAYLWTEYQVIAWLNDIGYKEAKYINKFKENGINGNILLNTLNVEYMTNDLGMNQIDGLLIEKSIFILKNIKDKVLMNWNETKEQNHDNLRFYKQKCEHLNRELLRMKKIEQMFKKNRRETESKLKQLECNLYFGSLSQSHLMEKFDINQLFKMQSAYNKTLLNIQQCIHEKVNNIKQKK